MLIEKKASAKTIFKNELQELARRTTEWSGSEEGKKSLLESERRISETVALLEKGRDIN